MLKEIYYNSYWINNSEFFLFNAIIKAKKRGWIKKVKPLTLTEKNDDGSPVFDRKQFENSARFASITEKNGGKVNQ